jgi:hypothetical protein
MNIKHTCLHARTYVRIHMYAVPKHTHMSTRMHTNANTLPHARTHALTYTQQYTRRHMSARVHARTRTTTNTLSHAHTHVRTHSHTHTHTAAHAHHISVCACMFCMRGSVLYVCMCVCVRATRLYMSYFRLHVPSLTVRPCSV